jgi:signal transduction histidine kinase
MTVRRRFAVTVAAVIAVTVALFATLSIVVIDRELRSGFEARLRTTAQAISTTVDVKHGRIAVDEGDLHAMSVIHADTPFAILSPSGAVLGGSVPPAAPQAMGLSTVTVPVIKDNVDAGSVTVWQSNVWIGDFDRDAAIVSAVVGLLLIVLGVAVSQRVARTALAPAERIASLAEQIEARDLSQRLGAAGNDELGRLCASFDRMLDRLEAAFAHERRFVADASHELRAPLAVLRAETELALRRPRTDAEYLAALESIERETVRLEDLVDELLAVARADVDASQRQDLDAGEIVEALAQRVRPAAALRGVEIHVDTPVETHARANRATVERALLAILHNAIAFAKSGGQVRLAVHPGHSSVRVEVADDGPGFSPEALQHATERFWRGDPARPRGGTGLGLAIARTLLEANGGNLLLSNGPGGGAVVTVSLRAT